MPYIRSIQTDIEKMAKYDTEGLIGFTDKSSKP